MFIIGGYLPMSTGPLIFLIVGLSLAVVLGTFWILSALKKRKENQSSNDDDSKS